MTGDIPTSEPTLEWVSYAPDGTISRILSMSQESALLNIPNGHKLLRLPNDHGASYEEHYVEVARERIREKTTFPALSIAVTYENEAYVISIGEVPIGTKVCWPDNVETLEDDYQVDFEVDYPGDYTFILSHPLYLEKKQVVNVTA
jgi:hypothetical protein